MKSSWITAVIALSAALMTLDMTVVTIALPDISRDLSAGLSDAQWIVNGYTLVFAALLLGVGAFSDRVPRRPLFMAGHVIFGLASLLCAAAPTTTWLIAGRIIQAIGATLVFATCMPLIADIYEDDHKRRSRAVGAFMAAGAAAAALGPLVGGMIVGSGGWRWIFAVNLPVSLIAVVAMFILGRDLPSKPRNSGNIDWLSTFLVAAGLFGANYALVSGPQDGWTSPAVVTAGICAVLLLTIFAVRQLHLGDDALINLRLFRIPSFSAAMILSFTARLVTFGLLPYLIFWLSGMQGRTPVQVGLVLLSLALPMVIVAAPSTALERTGRINVVTAGAMTVTAAGLLWLGLAMGPDATWRDAIAPLLVTGIGSGIAMPHMMNLALSVVPASSSGAATGAANTALPLGTATGVALFGALLSSRVDTLDWASSQVRGAITEGRLDILESLLPEEQLREAVDAFTSGLTAIFLTGAAFAILCAVVCLTAIRSKDQKLDNLHEEALVE